MGETVSKAEATPKKSKFKSFKSEFKKITWPDRQSIVKQTIAVIVITLIFGLIIAGVDAGYKMAINWLLKLG